MKFGYANNERKIQRVVLETAIIYGRTKPCGKSLSLQFLVTEGNCSSLLGQMLWHTELQNFGCSSCRKQLITLAPGKLIYYLALKNEGPWESLCKVYLGRNNYNEVKN